MAVLVAAIHVFHAAGDDVDGRARPRAIHVFADPRLRGISNDVDGRPWATKTERK
jgi:hypothetical protein